MKTLLHKAMTGHSDQRRAFQRYAVSMTVLVQPAVVEEASTRHRGMVTALVTDASLSGLVFVSGRPHPPGSQIEIQISLGMHVHLVQAVVKRSQVITLPGRRTFQCAAQFVRGDSMTRFIPALARYFYCRFGSNSSRKPMADSA